jgi:hypothetical protein
MVGPTILDVVVTSVLSIKATSSWASLDRAEQSEI